MRDAAEHFENDPYAYMRQEKVPWCSSHDIDVTWRRKFLPTRNHVRHTQSMKSDPRQSDTAEASYRCEEKQAEHSSVATSGGEQLSQEKLSERLAVLEREVKLGLRDARSSVAIPAELAKAAKVTFPENAFGKPKPW